MFRALRGYFKSIKFRIFLFLLIFGIAPGFALRAGILYAYKVRAVENRTVDITSQAKLLAAQIADQNYLDNPTSETLTTQLDLLSNIYDGRIILVNRAFTIIKDTYELDEQKTILSEEAVTAYNGEDAQKYDSENHYIEIALPIKNTSTGELVGEMIMSISTDTIESNVDFLNKWALIIQIALDVVILSVGLGTSTRIVRPLSRLTKEIENVKDGYEPDFKKVYTYTEADRLAKACKDMIDRMKVLDESREEFVSNVSHELKTPLTSMKVLADSLIGQENVPIELYREFMADIGAEIERENEIINDLLSLVKMDKSSGTLSVRSENINNMLDLIMKRLKPIARKQNVDLILESFRPVTAEVDKVKLTLALSNLIENAIKYNHADGWVHVTLNADHQNFYINVEDNGVGIPEEDQAHIFERFYRVDKSHSKEIGGTGLGLAIARNAVIMHRGAIKVHSMEGEGTTFTVRIPLTYVDQ